MEDGITRTFFYGDYDEHGHDDLEGDDGFMTEVQQA